MSDRLKQGKVGLQIRTETAARITVRISVLTQKHSIFSISHETFMILIRTFPKINMIETAI